MRTSVHLVVLCISLTTLSGCESLSLAPKKTSPAATLPANSLGDSYMDTLSALSGADRARQTDVFFEAERAYTQAPTTSNQVRYASALAVPGHAASDPLKAKKLLEQLLATPERLSSSERSLCELMLNVTDQWLRLQTESRRLAATVDDKSRAQSNSDRRFQAQAEEILRLRKALDAAQQKLDAIKDLEKSISERSTTPTGNRDTNSRDTPTQTQTTTVGR